MPPKLKKRRPGLQVVARPGSTALYLRGTVRGIRVYESAGTDDPALAEERRAVLEAALFREAVHGKPERKKQQSFAAAVTAYVEAAPRSQSTLRRLHRLLQNVRPHETCRDMNQERIDGLARVILRPGAKPDTRLREVITPIKAVLTHAAERGWCERPAFSKVRAGKARTQWFTPAEAEAIIAAANPHFRPLALFYFSTGARVSEALELAWDDVDLAHARATLRVKARHGDDVTRIVELPPRLLQALCALPARTGRVFLHSRGEPYADYGRAAGGQLRSVWNGTLARAKVRQLSPHVVRHTWASWHYAWHKDLLRLKKEGGWSSVTLVERYAHLTPPGMVPDILRVLGYDASGDEHAARVLATGSRSAA